VCGVTDMLDLKPLRRAKALLKRYELSRGAGHTSGMIDGVRATTREHEYVIMVVATNDQGKAIIDRFGLDGDKIKLVTPTEFDNGDLEGLYEVPIFIDNFVLYTMLGEMVTLVETVIGAHSLLTQSYKDMVVSLNTKLQEALAMLRPGGNILL